MNCVSKRDHIMLVNELTQGMEQAGQLKVQLGSSAASFQVQDLLLQRVLSSFEKALLILHWTGSAAQSLPLPPVPAALDSSLSMNSSTLSDNSTPNFIKPKNLKPESSKKRKTLPTWTEQVKVSAVHGLEGPSEDGYSWRKYGQKDILGANYPRNYYRCTYRHIQNCWATKQVQRSDDEPTVFDITYRGYHTCHQVTSNTQGSHKEKIEQKPTNFLTNHQTPQLLMNFQTTLGGEKTEDSISNNKNADFIFSSPSALTWFAGENQFESLLGTNPVSFSSPNMLESNYFSASSCNNNLQTVNNFLQQYENELTQIISADASSATNSANAGLQFSVDTVDLDHSFLCDITDFLS